MFSLNYPPQTQELALVFNFIGAVCLISLSVPLIISTKDLGAGICFVGH